MEISNDKVNEKIIDVQTEQISDEKIINLTIDYKPYSLPENIFKLLFEVMIHASPNIIGIQHLGKDYDIEKRSRKLLKVKNDTIIYNLADSMDVDYDRFEDMFEELISDDDNKKLYEKYKVVCEQILKSVNLESIISFFDYDNLTIENASGINEDDRGNDENILLPYIKTIKLNSTFTLNELFVAYHKIKSHKFDYWYELFCNVDITRSDNKMLIEFSFDHGS